MCKGTGHKEDTACSCRTHGRCSVPTAHNAGTDCPYGRSFHIAEKEYRPSETQNISSLLFLLKSLPVLAFVSKKESNNGIVRGTRTFFCFKIETGCELGRGRTPQWRRSALWTRQLVRFGLSGLWQQHVVFWKPDIARHEAVMDWLVRVHVGFAGKWSP